MSIVNIVISSDDNYVAYMSVCLYSLMKNSNINKQYQIFILDGGISISHKEKILYMMEEFKNFKITFIVMEEYLKDIPPDIFYKTKYFPIAAYYRFFLPEIFLHLNKLIYLDCDMVVLKDIAELYEKSPENNYLLAVRDQEILIMCKDNRHEKNNYFYKTLGLKNHKNYFNSGVMLLNLQKMRRDNILSKLLERLVEIKTPMFVDQCVLNSVCEGHVGFLEQNWNFMWNSKITNLDYMKIIDEPYNKEYENASQNPYIIHFNGSIQRPWINPSYEKAEYFWQYARMTPFYEEILYKNLTVNLEHKNILKGIAYYPKNVLGYYKNKLLSKITFGKMRKHYKQKRKELKARIKQVKQFLKGK